MVVSMAGDLSAGERAVLVSGVWMHSSMGCILLWVQLYLQFVGAIQDISLWLLLLTLFGLSREARWRRWTKILAMIYLVSQAVDIATFLPWEFAGPGMQWIDAITTGDLHAGAAVHLSYRRFRVGAPDGR